MAQLLVRDLDDDAKERLKRRAAKHGRSLEAEVRDILQTASIEREVHDLDGAISPSGFGSRMIEQFGPRGLTPKEVRRFERAESELRSRSMMRIPDFEA